MQICTNPTETQPTESCLVWNRTLCELSFIYIYTIVNRHLCSKMHIHTFQKAQPLLGFWFDVSVCRKGAPAVSEGLWDGLSDGDQGSDEEARGVWERPGRPPGPSGADRSHRSRAEVRNTERFTGCISQNLPKTCPGSYFTAKRILYKNKKSLFCFSFWFAWFLW